MNKNNFATLALLAATPLTASTTGLNLTEHTLFPDVVEYHQSQGSGTFLNIYSPTKSPEELENINILFEFADKLMSETVDMPSEFVDIVDKNFWDII